MTRGMAKPNSPTNKRESAQAGSPERQGKRRLVSAFRCRVWAQHSRPEEQLTDSACRTLRASIERSGQHQPALGRPVSDAPGYDIEIICGARRHAVARALGRDLLVEVRDISDAEAYVAMYEENLLRAGDSPYVRAQILLRALRSGTYSSQEDLGCAFHLSHSAVSRLLTLAQLPSVLVGAFRSPADIREAWGIELQRAWSDEGSRQAMAARARALSGNRATRTAREVYDALISPSGRSHPRLYRNLPVRGSSGAVLFHEQNQLSRVIFIIPKLNLGGTRREVLRQMMVRIIEGDRFAASLMDGSREVVR